MFVLTSPNGGNFAFPSNTSGINWYSAFVSANVTLEYSINNGTSWLPIVASYANNSGGGLPTEGTYSWLVPNTPSTQCLVRIKDAANANAFDVSDAVFTIRPHITVTAPNDVTSVTRCSNYPITWLAGGTSGAFKIEYSTDDTTWTVIENSISPTPSFYSYTYNWTLPNILTTNLKVRVSDAANSSKTDTSDAGMSVVLPANPVRILSANGGEMWTAGTTQNITYIYGSGTTSVSLALSYDNGTTWNGIINNTAATGSYSFLVPNIPSTTAKIRVTGNQNNGCDYDDSDAVFTIASSVAVTQPNGAESWQATVGQQGTTINMSNATMVVNTANYYDNGGISGNYTGAYTQTLVPDNPLNKLKIYLDSWEFGWNSRLYIYNGPTTSSPLLADLTGSSGAATYQSTHASGALTFFIVNNQGAAGWKGYITSVGTTTKEIKWNIVGTSKRFDLDYSIDGGSAWTRIVSDLPNTTGVYNWQVPNTPTTQAKVRVRDAGNNTILDASDSNFTIQNAGITVTEPNGGQTLFSYNTFTINWSYPISNLGTETVNLYYSINGGISWILIAQNIPNLGSYNWTIPLVDSPKTQSMIKISDSANSSRFDVSDNYFEIRPRIILISPNNNSTLFQTCTQSSVTWYGGATNSYKIEVTTDNGISWTILNSNYVSNSIFNSFDWSIPNIASENCKVKVTENSNSSYFDISDEKFTIQPSLRILSPLNNQVINRTLTNSITLNWESFFTSQYFNIDYSLNGGTTWVNIIDNQLFTNKTYNWNLPNINIANIKIRIKDNQNSCKSDIINIRFGNRTIALSNNSILENANVNTLVGLLSLNEPSLTLNNVEYSFFDTANFPDNNAFSLNSNSIYSNLVFDYEIKNLYSIRIKAKDLDTNEIYYQTVIISIIDIINDYPLGDSNGDYQVNVLDVVNVVQYITGASPNPFIFNVSDVNHDGVINVLDIVIIINIILNPAGRISTEHNQMNNRITNTNIGDAIFYWKNNDLFVKSDYEIAGLQLEFEHDFNYSPAQELQNNNWINFSNGLKKNILMFNNSGSVILPGETKLLTKSNNLKNDLIVINSSVSSNPGFSLRPIYMNMFSNDLVKIWPNPIYGNSFNIKVNSYLNFDKIALKIYNIQGKEIWSNNLNSNNTTFEFNDIYLQDLSSGVYSLSIDLYNKNSLISTVIKKLIID